MKLDDLKSDFLSSFSRQWFQFIIESRLSVIEMEILKLIKFVTTVFRLLDEERKRTKKLRKIYQVLLQLLIIISFLLDRI